MPTGTAVIQRPAPFATVRISLRVADVVLMAIFLADRQFNHVNGWA
jgi:hypothetical protein